MTELFQRSIEVEFSGANGFVFSNAFAINTTVQKSLDSSEPDEAVIEIVNLSRNIRSGVAQENAMKIVAGYADLSGIIFQGDVKSVINEYRSPDWVTIVRSGDGARAHELAAINKTYVAGVGLSEIIRDIAASMDTEVETAGDNEWLWRTYPRGKTISGDSKSIMNQLALDNGLIWSIQDGVLVITKYGDGRGGDPYLLNADSGLIAAPSLEQRDAKVGPVLRVQAMLNPFLIPGNRVAVESAALEDGTVLITILKTRFAANNREGPFTCFVEGTPV